MIIEVTLDLLLMGASAICFGTSWGFFLSGGHKAYHFTGGPGAFPAILVLLSILMPGFFYMGAEKFQAITDAPMKLLLMMGIVVVVIMATRFYSYCKRSIPHSQ
ncbi:MAG: hypothetical protein G01um101449_331 [Parcubacteria group bacterium Gr01-1014_49]|nr:MAG: hypothetical protein G01um101449_331 [Parcubacteria group bacterium Gr01-1014_49]